MKFGRNEHDPVAYAAAPQHVFADTPPAIVDRRHINYQPGMLGNDQWGDCTCVAYANGVHAVASLNGFDKAITTEEVLSFYTGMGGTQDSGLVFQKVMEQQAGHGFPISGDTMIANYGRVGHTEADISNGINRLGGLGIGVRLYQSDMDNFGATWVTDGAKGDLQGRHMVWLWDYNPARVRIATWGTLQPATWAWVEDRLDEAWGLVWRQLARADGSFYSGVNADGLVSQLASQMT